MNYEKIYNALVDKAKVRGLDKSQHEGYFEIHHILPVSLGGGNEKENLVMFTGREHFIAHMLLWKGFPEDISLQRAAWMMSARNVCKVNSKLYSAIQEVKRKEASEQMKGRYFKDLTGNRYERLIVTEIADPYISPQGLKYTRWSCVCDCGNEAVVHARSLSGGTTKSCGCLAAETRKKAKGNLDNISKYIYGSGEEHPNFGKKFSPERCAAMSEARKGQTYSDEAMENYRLAGIKFSGENHWNYGKEHSEDTRKNISIALKARGTKPWEVAVNRYGIHPAKWAMADYYFDLWLSLDKCGSKMFYKAFNIINNDDTTLATFAGMIKKFSSGWIPTQDLDWLEFRKREMNE